MYHAGVVNVYMASANPDAASYDGSGQKWFKVYEIPPVTNGGSSISFPGSGEWGLGSALSGAKH